MNEYLQKIRHISTADRPVKTDKSSRKQKTISATDRKLKDIESRQKKWAKDQDQQPGAGSKHVTYRKTYFAKGPLKHLYLTRRSDCNECPLKESCIKKSKERRITITVYKEEYDRAIERIKSREGRYMKNKRQSTVEPVFGTLINFMGMRKVNTQGIKQASKSMLMAAVATILKNT